MQVAKGRVLVRLLDKSNKRGAIAIGSGSTPSPVGIVTHKGEDDQWGKNPIEVGSKVLLPRNQGQSIEIEGATHFVQHWMDIPAFDITDEDKLFY